jgi:hypothetical protein
LKEYFSDGFLGWRPFNSINIRIWADRSSHPVKLPSFPSPSQIPFKKFFMCIYFILLTQMYYFLEKIMAKENLF